jgi:hypothetical protein
MTMVLTRFERHLGCGGGSAPADAALPLRLAAVADVASAALEEPDAWRGIEVFLERSLALQLADRGLNAILADPRLGGARVGSARARIAALADALVRRARDQGALSADVEGVDLVLLHRALAAVVAGPDGADAARCRRRLATFLDALRSGRAGAR